MSVTEDHSTPARPAAPPSIRAEFSFDVQTDSWSCLPLARTDTGYIYLDRVEQSGWPSDATTGDLWIRDALRGHVQEPTELDSPFSIAHTLVDERGVEHDVVLWGTHRTEAGRTTLRGVVLEFEAAGHPVVTEGLPRFSHALGTLPPGVTADALPWGMPPQDLPGELIATLNMCLDSAGPASLIWGDDRVTIYNTAMIDLLPDLHPHLFGRSIPQFWPEGWAVFGPDVDLAFATGVPSTLRDQRVPVRHRGITQDRYFSSSLNPLKDAEGRVVALLVPAIETTDQVLCRRRLSTLHGLASQAAVEASPAELFERLATVLAGDLDDLPFTLCYLVEPGERVATLQASTGIREAAGAAPEHLLLDRPTLAHPTTAHPTLDRPGGDPAEAALGWPVAAAVAQQGRLTIVDDVARRFPGFLAGVEAQQQTHAVLCYTELGERLPNLLIVLGVSTRQALDAEYQAFLTKVARHVQADLTAVATAALDRDRTANLQRAMQSNRQIGAAIGILMTVHKITEQQAFLLLSKASQQANRKLRDIADDVIATGALPADTMLRQRRTPNRRRDD